MKFSYSKENLNATQKIWQRVFEIIPGVTSWAILIGMIILSLKQPLFAAILIIAFYIYWFFRLIYMTIFLTLSFIRLKMEKNTPWMQRIEDIDNHQTAFQNIDKKYKKANWLEQISLLKHKSNLIHLLKCKNLPPASKDIYHLIIYPIAKENIDIIEPAIKSLTMQPFPTQRIFVIFALEDRASEEVKNNTLLVEQRYKWHFNELITFIHPDNLPNEARVKGANVTYAAKHAAEIIKRKNIPFENIIVSCFDADTVVSPSYVPCLTYSFMITPNRIQCSYQPIPVYHNNIWDVPGFARVMETGSSFFQLIEATNPEKLVTFSSHSMSFKALVDVGYWPIDMISDDSAIYWKALIHYEGQYQVVPLRVTLSMDIAGSSSILETAKSVYKQKRRWAWGVENFPIVMRAFLRKSKIPMYDRLRYGFKLLEGHISWSTWGFLLSFIGWLPAVFAQEEFSNSVLYYNSPRVAEMIFQLAAISLITSIIISINLLPKRKTPYSFLKKILHALEWLMIPIILVFFSALPALDAQTRLMFGRYMEFWVTEKKRKATKS